MKKNPAGIIIFLIIVIALIALNPTKDDFGKYLQKKTEKNVGGAFGKLAGGVASLVSNAYERDNLFLFSLYYTKSGSKKSDMHIGLLKSFIPVSKKK